MSAQLESSAQRETLHRVRNLLAQDWIQGHAAVPRPGGRWGYCVNGAISAATDDYITRAQVFERISSMLPPGVHGSISFWNDRPERTHAEVLALIDKAIASTKGTDISVFTDMLEAEPCPALEVS